MTKAWERRSLLFSFSGGNGWARDLPPDPESFPSFLTVSRRGESVTTWAEVLPDGTISGEEPLRVARRFEPLHGVLPLAGRLVRVFCLVVEIAGQTMFHSREELSLSGSITLQFIGDEAPGDIR